MKNKLDVGTSSIRLGFAVMATLALASAPASALVPALGVVTVNTTVTPSGGTTLFTYQFINDFNLIFNPKSISAIELPELNAGDFSLASFTTSKPGWTATETLSSPYSSTFKTGTATPGAYIRFTAPPGGELTVLGNRDVTVSLTTTLPGTIDAKFSVISDGVVSFVVDPPVPGPLAAVPEPASLLLLGGAAAATLMRRRRVA